MEKYLQFKRKRGSGRAARPRAVVQTPVLPYELIYKIITRAKQFELVYWRLVSKGVKELVDRACARRRRILDSRWPLGPELKFTWAAGVQSTERFMDAMRTRKTPTIPGSLSVMYGDQAANAAVAVGNIEILEFLANRGLPREIITEYAASHGDIEVLDDLEEAGLIAIDANTMEAAVQSEKLKVVLWVWKRGAHYTPDTTISAAGTGNHKLVRHMYYYGPRLSKNQEFDVADAAVNSNNSDVVDWLARLDIRPSWFAFNAASKWGDLDMLKAVAHSGCKWESGVSVVSTNLWEEGDVEMLEWWYSRNRWYRYAGNKHDDAIQTKHLKYAARNGRIGAIRFYYEKVITGAIHTGGYLDVGVDNTGPNTAHKIFYEAAKNGYTALMDYILPRMHGIEIPHPNAWWHAAMKRGNLQSAEWLRVRDPERSQWAVREYGESAVADALLRSDFRVLEWMRAQGYVFSKDDYVWPEYAGNAPAMRWLEKIGGPGIPKPHREPLPRPCKRRRIN